MLRFLEPVERLWPQPVVWSPDRRLATARRRIWTPRQPGYFAGDIKGKRGTPVALTVTNLQSLASNSTFTTGWTSAWVDDTSITALDYEVSGQISAGSSPTAGSVRVYVYALHADGSTAPDLFSTGTEGTEGSGTVIHDTEQLAASFILLWSSDIDTTTNDVYTMTSRSIKAAFNGVVPLKWALFVAHDTVAALRSSANAFYYTPIIAQYT